jgi:putative transposase
VVDFVKDWTKRTDIAVTYFIAWLGIAPSKYYNWQIRYGKANEHNALIPRDFWLEDWGKKAIIDFYLEHPLEGYRRLTFMMLDHDVVAVSPSSVYRVLSAANLLQRWNRKASKKGTEFVQPLKPHDHFSSRPAPYDFFG